MHRSTTAAEDAVAVAARGVDALVSALAEQDALEPETWLEVVAGCQGLVNQLTAVQDTAIAHAARFEPTWCEDGTQAWVEHGPGRVALGSADLVAGRIGASHHQAARRVEQAVRLTGRQPVEVDDSQIPSATGLDRLHEAMRRGRLDAYRAGVVAEELLDCPADVTAAVVAALEPHLPVEPAAGLRRRTRRLLARISPGLLRQRVARARSETGLRRWADEPGVDVWHGRFPSEESAVAWAAVDALARRYVAEGVCTSVEQARGKALTDLVTRQADVDVRLVLTVPAEALPATTGDEDPEQRHVAGSRSAGHPQADPEGDQDTPVASPALDAEEALGKRAPRDPNDLVQVLGPRPSEPVLVSARWLAQHTTELARAVCAPGTGARIDPCRTLAGKAYRPTESLAALVRSRDGRCRFPGCSVAARFCDLDHVRPWPGGPTTAENLLCLCRRHHRLKQAPGWRLRLAPDGTATWWDPTGWVRTTAPLDALEVVVLRPLRGDAARVSMREGRAPPSPLPSLLEERHAWRIHEHEVLVEHRRRRSAAAVLSGRHAPGRPRCRDDSPPF